MAFKARRFFNLHLSEDLKSNWIPNYNNSKDHKIPKALNTFGTWRNLPLVNVLLDLETLIGNVENISPLEYATAFKAINEKLKARQCILPPIFLAEIMASVARHKGEAWFTCLYHLTGDAPIKE